MKRFVLFLTGCFLLFCLAFAAHKAGGAEITLALTNAAGLLMAIGVLTAFSCLLASRRIKNMESRELLENVGFYGFVMAGFGAGLYPWLPGPVQLLVGFGVAVGGSMLIADRMSDIKGGAYWHSTVVPTGMSWAATYIATCFLVIGSSPLAVGLVGAGFALAAGLLSIAEKTKTSIKV